MILFVGNTVESLREQAVNFDASAKLINKEDIPNLASLSVGYTSINEFHIKNFVTILEISEEIHYVPSDEWAPDLKQITEFWLRYYSHRKPVHNFDTELKNQTIKETILKLADTRKSQNPQIWGVGCSITYGEGVEQSQIYANIIGQSFNLPVSLLAQPGSSIPWAADQILRSDIRKNDIVVWGLTGMGRFTFYDGGEIQQIISSSQHRLLHNIISPKILVSDHVFYSAITCIQQVIEQSKHIGYKLVLTQMPLTTEHQLDLLDYLSQFEFFVHTHIDFEDPYLDYDINSDHPGPKHHQHMADLITDFLKK